MAPVKLLVVVIYLCIFGSTKSSPSPADDLQELLNLTRNKERWYVSAKLIDRRYTERHPYSEELMCTPRNVKFSKCNLSPVVMVCDNVFICNHTGTDMSWNCGYLFPPQEDAIDGAATDLRIYRRDDGEIELRYGFMEYDEVLSMGEKFRLDGRLKSYERFINLRHAESVDC